jgi:hypothetical protein
MAYYFLSYCDDEKEFLGGCVIVADSLEGAIAVAERRRLNPGGTVSGFEIPPGLERRLADVRINVLLSREQVDDIKLLE